MIPERDYRVNKQYILVRIDKAAQKKKREKVGNIYLPVNFTYMAYNLQYGEILQIGATAAKNYPDAKVGDIAIFHHHIEGSYEDHAPEYLLETMPNGDEHRLIDCNNFSSDYKIFAIIKDGGTLIPSPYFVFVSQMITPIKRKFVSDLIAGSGYEPSEDELRQKLEQLLAHQRVLDESLQSETSVDKSQQIVNAIADIGRERERITQFLNSDKFVKTKVTFINPETYKELGIDIGDEVVVTEGLLYGLEIMGNKFLVMRKDFIIGKMAPALV